MHGHFVYLKGQHAPRYTNKTAAFVRSSNVRVFARAIADHFCGNGIEVLVAPELGAIQLMAHVQEHLSVIDSRDIFGVIATKIWESHPDPEIAKLGYRRPTKKFEIVRDQARFVKGRRVLVIEDVFSTGSSVQNTIEAIAACDGIPVAAAVLMNQGGVTAEDVGLDQTYSLIDDLVEQYFGNCPLCKDRIPINTEVGKGKDFLLTDEARELGLVAA
jgi:orotate phosphoribosyltransferase